MGRKLRSRLITTQSGNANENELLYLRTGLSKHGILLEDDNSSQPKDEILTSYLDKFRPEKRKQETIFQLRVCLASVIEAVIVLDRLLYLLENADYVGGEKVGLIRCFDPVISPRCYALVAVT